MGRILAIFAFLLLSVWAGEVSVYRGTRTLTARPFEAKEIRVLFSAYGKQKAKADAPGICPPEWTFPEKPRPHFAALMQWNASFDTKGNGKYRFMLSEPSVCSALFVDGSAVASWKEHFGGAELEEGRHSMQLLVVQRPGEKLPQVQVFREGYPVTLEYGALQPKRPDSAVLFVQTGNCLIMEKGGIRDGDGNDGLKCLVPAKRVDARAWISSMLPVAVEGRPIEIGLTLEYPEIAVPFMAALDVNVRYESDSGKLLGSEKFQIGGRSAALSLRPASGSGMASFAFSVAGKEILPVIRLHLVSAEGKTMPRASGRGFFCGDERAVLMTDSGRLQCKASQQDSCIILDSLGEEECLAYAKRRFPSAEIRRIVPDAGTLPELCVLEALPSGGGRVVLLGRFSPEMLDFVCRRCAAKGLVPIAVALPGDRSAALSLKEACLRLDVKVLDLWAEMLR